MTQISLQKSTLPFGKKKSRLKMVNHSILDGGVNALSLFGFAGWK